MTECFSDDHAGKCSRQLESRPKGCVEAVTVRVVRVRAIVHGRVQGVFFRDTTRREAEARGISGWVRNRPDGTVEALFEGDPDAVEVVIAFCREGPHVAVVERVEVSEEEPEGLAGVDVR
jgi:acylphosphatase